MTTNLLALAQHKIYLQSRIALLVQKHADYKAKETETEEGDHKLALNSSAACIWDAKCEMEQALDNLAIAEQKAYPFTPLSCTLYEYSGPCMKIQLPDGTKVDISLPDGNHGSFFEQLDKLLTTGTSMVFGYNAEYRDAAEKKKGATFQMHYPKEPTSFSKEMEDQVIQEFKKDEANVFDLLANVTKPQTVHISDEANNRVYNNYPSLYPAKSFAPTPTDVSKAIVEPAKESFDDKFSTTKLENGTTIHMRKNEALSPDPNEPKSTGFIVEPDESNSNIGHED